MVAIVCSVCGTVIAMTSLLTRSQPIYSLLCKIFSSIGNFIKGIFSPIFSKFKNWFKKSRENRLENWHINWYNSQVEGKNECELKNISDKKLDNQVKIANPYINSNYNFKTDTTIYSEKSDKSLLIIKYFFVKTANNSSRNINLKNSKKNYLHIKNHGEIVINHLAYLLTSLEFDDKKRKILFSIIIYLRVKKIDLKKYADLYFDCENFSLFVKLFENEQDEINETKINLYTERFYFVRQFFGYSFVNSQFEIIKSLIHNDNFYNKFLAERNNQIKYVALNSGVYGNGVEQVAAGVKFWLLQTNYFLQNENTIDEDEQQRQRFNANMLFVTIGYQNIIKLSGKTMQSIAENPENVSHVLLHKAQDIANLVEKYEDINFKFIKSSYTTQETQTTQEMQENQNNQNNQGGQTTQKNQTNQDVQAVQKITLQCQGIQTSTSKSLKNQETQTNPEDIDLSKEKFEEEFLKIFNNNTEKQISLIGTNQDNSISSSSSSEIVKSNSTSSLEPKNNLISIDSMKSKYPQMRHSSSQELLVLKDLTLGISNKNLSMSKSVYLQTKKNFSDEEHKILAKNVDKIELTLLKLKEEKKENDISIKDFSNTYFVFLNSGNKFTQQIQENEEYVDDLVKLISSELHFENFKKDINKCNEEQKTQQRNKTDNIMSPVYWTTVKTVYLFTYLCCLKKSVENVQEIIENMRILINNVQNFCNSYMINLLTPLLIQYLVENSETLAEIMYDPDKIKNFTLNKFNENEYKSKYTNRNENLI